jgi:hypothetical protein
MAIMISELYDALIAAGAPEEKARKAAETMAGFENRFAKIEADLLLLKWMTGTAIVLLLGGFGILARLMLDVLSRLPHA